MPLATEVPVFEVVEDKVLPEVLDTYFRTWQFTRRFRARALEPTSGDAD